MKRISSALIALALLSDLSVATPARKSEPKQLRATKIEIKEGETPSSGRLYITVDEKELKIADAVSN